ncbi:hypothetical protein HAX54_039293 [Datura stramonium]|uniref:Uncharacterized protein n=1 Tax=Datura stramonium TaxID=4076 RepID=A0ABS8VNF4_DATST|nr:hypothetical protein [Datura stramonium]
MPVAFHGPPIWRECEPGEIPEKHCKKTTSQARGETPVGMQSGVQGLSSYSETISPGTSATVIHLCGTWMSTITSAILACDSSVSGGSSSMFRQRSTGIASDQIFDPSVCLTSNLCQFLPVV